jgi:hypothetical protein
VLARRHAARALLASVLRQVQGATADVAMARAVAPQELSSCSSELGMKLDGAYVEVFRLLDHALGLRD